MCGVEAEVETKRTSGPRERVDPVAALAQLLSAWATVIKTDPGFQAVLASVPRKTRRELARRFAYLVVGIREEA